jgi:ribonucleoside-triphosphate reductase
MTKEDIEDAVLSIIAMFSDKDCVDIEEIQDAVESTLMSHQFFAVSKSYILYRDKHRQQREAS